MSAAPPDMPRSVYAVMGGSWFGEDTKSNAVQRVFDDARAAEEYADNAACQASVLKFNSFGTKSCISMVAGTNIEFPLCLVMSEDPSGGGRDVVRVFPVDVSAPRAACGLVIVPRAVVDYIDSLSWRKETNVLFFAASGAAPEAAVYRDPAALALEAAYRDPGAARVSA